MASIRCFDSFNTNLTASEWSSAKRKKTIYNEIQKNVYLYATANPVKQNGKEYNKTTKVNSTCDISSGYIEYAESYLVMNEVSEGAALCNPTPVHNSHAVLMETCSTACSNTFDSGFQDTGGDGGVGQKVVISGVEVDNSKLAVYDEAAEISLRNLDTNANKNNEFIDFGGPFIIPAGQIGHITQMGTGAFRYRNATFMGEFDITVNQNPTVVFQFSQDGIHWFSDGNAAALFDPLPPSTIRQFCLQRSNVPTLWIGLYYVTPATANKIQLVLTKS
jgi:hypothetical protein